MMGNLVQRTGTPHRRRRELGVRLSRWLIEQPCTRQEVFDRIRGLGPARQPELDPLGIQAQLNRLSPRIVGSQGFDAPAISWGP